MLTVSPISQDRKHLFLSGEACSIKDWLTSVGAGSLNDGPGVRL